MNGLAAISNTILALVASVFLLLGKRLISDDLLHLDYMAGLGDSEKLYIFYCRLIT